MLRYSDTYYNQVYLLLNYKTLQEKSLGNLGEEESLRYLSICLCQQLVTEGSGIKGVQQGTDWVGLLSEGPFKTNTVVVRAGIYYHCDAMTDYFIFISSPSLSFPICRMRVTISYMVT